MTKDEYFELFKRPEWQKRRLQILERDNWKCQGCPGNDGMLYVHHRYYEWDSMPWDYPDEALITLCEDCHDQEHFKYTPGDKDLEFEEKSKEGQIREISKFIKKNFLSSELFDLSLILNNLNKLNIAKKIDLFNFSFSLLDDTLMKFINETWCQLDDPKKTNIAIKRKDNFNILFVEVNREAIDLLIKLKVATNKINSNYSSLSQNNQTKEAKLCLTN